MGGIRQMLSAYGNVPESEVRGTRAPFLQGGGDKQMNMMEELGFSYDCSMPTMDNSEGNLHILLCTLDYGPFHLPGSTHHRT